MKNDTLPEMFADGIVDISHANGVFRITFGQQAAEGKVKPVVKVLIPSNQVGTAIQYLTSAVNDIAGKIKEKADEKGATKKAPAAKKVTPARKKKPS